MNGFIMKTTKLTMTNRHMSLPGVFIETNADTESPESEDMIPSSAAELYHMKTKSRRDRRPLLLTNHMNHESPDDFTKTYEVRYHRGFDTAADMNENVANGRHRHAEDEIEIAAIEPLMTMIPHSAGSAHIALSRRLWLPLAFIQVFGFMPFCLGNYIGSYEDEVEKMQKFRKTGKRMNSRAFYLAQKKDNERNRRLKFAYRVTQIVLNAWLGFCIFANVYLFLAINLPDLRQHSLYYGPLHGFTVAAIVLTTKTAFNAAQLVLFGVLQNRHMTFWKKMNKLERTMKSHFRWYTHIRQPIIVFIVVHILFSLYALDAMESMKNDQPWYSTFVMAPIMILAPIFTIWSMVPTIYFYVVYSILLQWTRHIVRQIGKDVNGDEVDMTVKMPTSPVVWKYSLHEVNTITNEFVELLSCSSDMFGAWILCVWCYSLAVLTMAITFLTQQASYLQVPQYLIEQATPQDIDALYIRFYFNMAWMAVQVVLAAVNVKLIDHYGVLINEKMRLLLPVLSRRCQLPFEHTTDTMTDANFVLTSIQGLYFSQSYWGVSAWRFFLIERSALLSIVSLMATYAAVLMKYRETTGVPMMQPKELLRESTTNVPMMIDEFDFDYALSNVTTNWMLI